MAARFEAWDAAFVRARRRDVHPILVAVAEYGRWWPGVDACEVGDRVALTLRPPGRLRASQRVLARMRRERPGLGLELDYAGDVEGEAEWFYLNEPAGVVVHYIVRARVPSRRWRRRVEAHRATVRAGLHALKDRLEGGRPPGTEPSAGLLADQREAIADDERRSRAGRVAVLREAGAMSEAVQGSTTVEADVATVFDVVADFEAYPQWQPEIKQADVLETDDRGRGARVRYVVDATIFKATVVLEYSYTDTSMSWVLAEGDAVRRNDGTYTFADQGDGTTLVTYELEVEPAVPVPGMLRRRAAQRIIDTALTGMKQRAEARA